MADREEKEKAFHADAQRLLDKRSICQATDADGRRCDRYLGHPGAHHQSGVSRIEMTKAGEKQGGQGEYLDRDTTMSHDMRTSHALFHRWQHRGARNRVIKPDKNYPIKKPGTMEKLGLDDRKTMKSDNG